MGMIATFHTHFGAMSFQKKLQTTGVAAEMMPVPRALSASCGVCVRFDGTFDPKTMPNSDLDAVYRSADDGSYHLIYQQQED